jgi:CHAT domain-containing protein/lipopolysaccharide biosynthesis regulator YciM
MLVATACSEEPAKLYQSAKDLYTAGRFDDACKKAEQGYSLFRSQSQSEWRWKFAVLAAELEMLRGNTTRADTFLLDTPPARFAWLIPRFEMLRGYSLYRHSSPEGQGLLKRAITDAQSIGDSETLVDAWLYLGTSQLSGDLGAADSAFRRAQELAEVKRLEYRHAAALVNRGYIQMKRERYANAIPLLEAARVTAEGAGATFLSTSALENLANCYESLGNLDQALAVLETSVVQQKRFGLATFLSDDYSELGVIHMRKGESTEAIWYFRQAFELVSEDTPVQYAAAAANLASVLLQIGSLDEAERFNQIAFAAADPRDKNLVGPATITAASIAERRGHHDQAITIYEKALNIGNGMPSIQWQAYAGLAGVYSAQGNFANANDGYLKALTVIASNRADQLKSDYKITFLSNLIRFYQDYVALLIRHGDSNRALEIADSSRASVLTEDLLGRSETSRPALLPQIQKAARTSHSVFLFYWLAPKSSYLWAISGAQSKAVPLSDQRQISQDVASYRALIEQEKRDPLASSSQAGARLYQQLIAPVSALLPRGSRVVVIPDGVLHNLNFETLLVPSPQPHFWIEDVTVSIAPSLGIVQAGKTRLSVRRSLLLMGDPVTQGTGYPPLPQAALEIAKVQRQFPANQSTVLTGAQAVVDAYSAAQPGRFSTIHFATHVDANAQSPLDSSIILSPQPNGFRLYARDVAQMPLHADLVTISACRGAGARTLSGEGLVGFVWAFFQARAQNVVTSLWDVYDNSTAQLMDDFYSGVAAGHSYADSLRQAKLKMLHSNYQRPYYWAPFQLYSRTT